METGSTTSKLILCNVFIGFKSQFFLAQHFRLCKGYSLSGTQFDQGNFELGAGLLTFSARRVKENPDWIIQQPMGVLGGGAD